ncbi:DMT family transporter [Sphingomonas arenae]|uniref:DMT family transporter n=1 Tax=Sphingomonas arenae TaxID=2812555 RepID=UPI001968A073|nr:DMT family transporter [Sphingomonas arenae]
MINRVMTAREWSLLLLLALIWGGAFVFIHVVVRSLPPLTYVWLRVLFASAALWLYFAVRRESIALPREAWVPIIGMALLNNLVPFALFGWAQTQIASGLASILNATSPIWGVIVAHFFTRDEPLTPLRTLGLLLGFGGLLVMLGPDIAGADGTLMAELACVVAALLYAVAGVWARRFRALGVTPTAVATGQLTAGAVLMTPVALLVDRPWLLPAMPIEGWGALIALAVLCTAIGYILYFQLIHSAGATNALLVTLLVPPAAILLGGLLLGEVLAGRDLAGLLLIGLGLAAIDGRLMPRRVTALP